MRNSRVIAGLIERIRSSHAAHLMDLDEIDVILPIIKKRINEASWATAKMLNVGPQGKVEVMIAFHLSPYEPSR
jgi:hypothetical protein